MNYSWKQSTWLLSVDILGVEGKPTPGYISLSSVVGFHVHTRTQTKVYLEGGHTFVINLEIEALLKYIQDAGKMAALSAAV